MVKIERDMEKVIFLRKIGWSHKDIAKFMGYSETWCRHNLSKYQKDKELMHQAAVIAEMYIKQVKETTVKDFNDYPENFVEDFAEDCMKEFGTTQFNCECCGKDINVYEINQALSMQTTNGQVFCSEDCLISTYLDDDQIAEIKKARLND